MGQVSSVVRADGAYVTSPRRLTVTQVQTCRNDGDKTGLSQEPLNPVPTMILSFDQSSGQIVAKRSDSRPLEFVQDPETNALVLKVAYLPSITVRFRLSLVVMPGHSMANLTFVAGNTHKEVQSFVGPNSELFQNPNIQNEDNVVYLGSFEATDQPLIQQLDFLWVWEPLVEKLGGWPTHFCFCEYDRDSHTLSPLVGGALWVGEPPDGGISSTLAEMMSPQQAATIAPVLPGGGLDMLSPDSSLLSPLQEKQSDLFPTPTSGLIASSGGSTNISQKLPVSLAAPAQRPRPDLGVQPEDGPGFRSAIASMERQSGTLKACVKQLLKRALYAQERLQAVIEAEQYLASAIMTAAETDIPALKPILGWFDRKRSDSGGFTTIQWQRKLFLTEMSTHIVSPLRELYEHEIKSVELHRREFEDESSQYYSWMSRYLAGTKKGVPNDAKYVEKKRAFELARFDYWSYLLDLHGGRKQQQLVRHIAHFSQATTDSIIALGSELTQRVRPDIDAIVEDLKEAAKDWENHRTDRETRRRTLERSVMPPPSSAGFFASPLPEFTSPEAYKEGLLWALSRPQDIPNTKWHKFWVVQSSGMLSEYTNWRQGGDLHSDPINLLVASVREAKSSDRKFCFEVVTPSYRRIYQAQSEDDMRAWIQSINRGIVTTLEKSGSPPLPSEGNIHVNKRQGGDTKLEALTRKLSFKDHRPRIPPIHTHLSHHVPGQTSAAAISAGAVLGPGIVIPVSGSQSASAGALMASSPPRAAGLADIVTQLQAQHPSNRRCADCGGSQNVEWVSINLLVILCIECSGAHRSLGSHISKIRSLTLDSISPDLLAALSTVSNDLINHEVWEARLPSSQKLLAHAASSEERLKFATSKYLAKQWMFRTAEPALALSRAVIDQSVIGVLAALAAYANPDAESNGESLLVCALRHSPPEATTFPVAEVLYVNGAMLPAEIPAGVLPHALNFLRVRAARA